MNLAFVRDWFRRYWLAVWFGTVSGLGVLASLDGGTWPAFDADLYLTATRAWLDGGNPWAVQLAGFYFAAPPPTLLPLAPFALLPHHLGVAALAAAVCFGCVATVRMLRLPLWWLLFPPIVHCVLSANVQGLLVPLILGGHGWLAILFKSYAAVPLVIMGRWRQLAIAAAATLASAPVLPWGEFVNGFDQISHHLSEQSQWGVPASLLALLLPIGIVALALAGRERAAWLAVPGLWPSPQLYYATLAVPARSTLAAAIISVPIQGSGFLALIAVASIACLRGETKYGLVIRTVVARVLPARLARTGPGPRTEARPSE